MQMIFSIFVSVLLKKAFITTLKKYSFIDNSHFQKFVTYAILLKTRHHQDFALSARFKFFFRVVYFKKELEEFATSAVKILSLEIDKDDHKGLLSIMNILNKIDARQTETDQMFEPLKNIVQLLKGYHIDFDKRILNQVIRVDFILPLYAQSLLHFFGFCSVDSLPNFPKNGLLLKR